MRLTCHRREEGLVCGNVCLNQSVVEKGDDLAQQREVQVAEHGETVNSEATREESYHTFFGETLSTWKRGEERHAVETQ